MKTAVIGAGLSGLAAAHELAKAGREVTVFEKSSAVGGRLASRRVEINGRTVIFDSGAQNIKAPDSALDRVARELLSPDEIVEIAKPVWLHDGTQALPGDESANAEVKWTCASGITVLPKALARGLDIRLNACVATVDIFENQICLTDESGNEAGRFDRLILSAPAPQCADLIDSGNCAQDFGPTSTLLRQGTFRNCLSVMLWFETTLDAPWYALLAQDRDHPLLWLAHTDLGNPGAAGTALIAQLGPACSRSHYGDSDESILADVCQWIADMLGAEFGERSWFAIERWRYAQPESMVGFDAVNSPGSRIVVCGDGLAGGKAHLAYDSGLRAARYVIAG